jgi:hypothetical protein
VRAQDYAERKKEYETQKAASKANLEARSKLIGQLGLEGYKALMKPAAAGPHGYITLTQDMVDRVKQATGKVIDPGLIGTLVPSSILTGKPAGTNYPALNYQLGRDRMNTDAARDWRNSDFYKAHLGLSRATASILALSKNPASLSDKAIIFFINKVLDANSAVLAGEQKSWAEGSNFIEGLRGQINRFRGQRNFSDKDAAQIVTIAKELHRASKKLFDAERATTINTNREFGISPNAYQGIDYAPKDYKDYESSSGTSAATSTSKSVDNALSGGR